VDGITFAAFPLRRPVRQPDGTVIEQPIPWSEYRALRWSIGDLNAGKSIRYRITVTNRGVAPSTSVKIFDTTPAYTVYTTTGPAATTVGSVTTAPANGATGALEFNIGTLNPGESAVVTSGVLINN